MLRFTPRERRQAFAYRDMVRRARRRSRASREGPASPPRPLRGRQIDKPHKAAVARLFCLATHIRTGAEITGVHVAHLRFSNTAAGARNPGLQRKPDDRWTLPLSPNEHRRQHAMGESIYWAELGVDPHRAAAELWAASPAVEAMRQVLRTCRQNTGGTSSPSGRPADD